LTDAERYELVEVPWNEHTRHYPGSQADHLQRVVIHLPKVPVELRQQWLQTVLSFTYDHDLQRGLMALLPSLSGNDRRQAADALVGLIHSRGRFVYVAITWSSGACDGASDGFPLLRVAS
jgi:hypothetical protein